MSALCNAPPKLDRNLALELVRVTEAVAMAAAPGSSIVPRAASAMTANAFTVAIPDRPRHQGLVGRVLATGARIKDLIDGDVAGAIMAAGDESSVDVLVGIGGTPEGIAACALRCHEGENLGRLRPLDDAERAAAVDAGHDVDHILTISDLVRGEDVFFAATGITDGVLLRGVRIRPPYVATASLSMRFRSGAVREIRARHHATESNLIAA